MDKNQKSTNGANVQNLKSSLPFWRQLRWNLILYFIALTVIPLAIVINIVLNQAGEQAKAQIGRQLESVAKLKIDQINRWLDDSDLALEFFLSKPIYSQLVAFVVAATPAEQEQNQLNNILRNVIESRDTD